MKFSAALTLLGSVSRCLIAVAMLLILGRASAWQWAIASLAVSAVSTCVAVAIVTRFFGLPSFSLSLLKKRFRRRPGFCRLRIDHRGLQRHR